jgi:soluble lytic murein transglycosylase-like protein
MLIGLLVVSFPHAKIQDVAPTAMALAQISQLPFERDLAGMMATMQKETGGTLRSDLVSKKGACGVMQVLPKWSKNKAFTCKDMKLPLSGLMAGIYAWDYWEGVADELPVAAYYNGGNNPKRDAKAYAKAWTKHRNRIEIEMSFFVEGPHAN